MGPAEFVPGEVVDFVVEADGLTGNERAGREGNHFEVSLGERARYVLCGGGDTPGQFEAAECQSRVSEGVNGEGLAVDLDLPRDGLPDLDSQEIVTGIKVEVCLADDQSSLRRGVVG